MTFCKALSERNINGKTVTAYRLIDKYTVSARYEITVSINSVELYTIKTARSTWKKKLSEVISELA